MSKTQTCVECVMDTDDSQITFDGHGVCNYCNTWKASAIHYGKIPNSEQVFYNEVLPKVLATAKQEKYHCIIGISGGIDSSYLAYLVKVKMPTLNPLLVHVKNDAWDTPVSKRNLQRILDFTGFDIVYPTVNMVEYVALQRAYFYASVIDTDVPADYLIEAFIRLLAKKNHVHYVFSGGNFFSDAFMPTTWNYPNKLDRRNLMGIYKWYGDGVPLKSFPKFGAKEVLISNYFSKLHYITPLNYFGYNRFEALKTLQKLLGYEAYADKHYENYFTRFYQAYILPTKFGVDKRKMNYSNYIRSGGLTRSQALLMLKEPLYSPIQFQFDKDLVLSTLGFSDAEFERIMCLPVVSHEVFGTDKWIYDYEAWIRQKLKQLRDYGQWAINKLRRT